MTHSPNNVRNETEKEEENGRTTSTRYKKGSWAVKDWGPFFRTRLFLSFLVFFGVYLYLALVALTKAHYIRRPPERGFGQIFFRPSIVRPSRNLFGCSQLYAMAIQQVDIPFNSGLKSLETQTGLNVSTGRLDYFDQRRAGRYWIADRILW